MHAAVRNSPGYTHYRKPYVKMAAVMKRKTKEETIGKTTSVIIFIGFGSSSTSSSNTGLSSAKLQHICFAVRCIRLRISDDVGERFCTTTGVWAGITVTAISVTSDSADGAAVPAAGQGLSSDISAVRE